MAYEIKWTKKAEKSFEQLVNYLEKNWSEKSAGKFVQITDKKLRLIAENPDIFPDLENKKGIKKGIITKQTSLYYRVYKKAIQLITFWDNRKNPEMRDI